MSPYSNDTFFHQKILCHEELNLFLQSQQINEKDIVLKLLEHLVEIVLLKQLSTWLRENSYRAKANS